MLGPSAHGTTIIAFDGCSDDQQIMLLMWEPAYQGSSLVFKEDYTSGIFLNGSLHWDFLKLFTQLGFFKMVHSIEIFLLGSFQDFFKPWFHLQFFFTWPLQVFFYRVFSLVFLKVVNSTPIFTTLIVGFL